MNDLDRSAEWWRDPASRRPEPRETSGAAIAALVFGILGFVVLPLLGSILAIGFGGSARHAIDESGGRLGGRGLAVAGLVLGWVGLGICLFFIALVLWAASEGGDVHVWLDVG